MRSHYPIILLFTTLIFLTTCANAQVLKDDAEQDFNKKQEFIAFNPDYTQLLNTRLSRIKTLWIQVFNKESSGRHAECEHQMLGELVWLYAFTADFKKMDARLNDLELLLKSPPPDNKD